MYPAHPDDEDTSAYVASLLFSREDTVREDPAMHALTLRIPVALAAHLIALAKNSDVSRNEMGRLLLQSGIDAVYAKLPLAMRHAFEQEASEIYQDMIEKG